MVNSVESDNEFAAASSNVSVTFVCVAAPWADRNRRHLSPRAKIIGTFEAGSLVEAMTIFYQFMGWEEYKPSEIDDTDPYPDTWSN